MPNVLHPTVGITLIYALILTLYEVAQYSKKDSSDLINFISVGVS